MFQIKSIHLSYDWIYDKGYTELVWENGSWYCEGWAEPGTITVPCPNFIIFVSVRITGDYGESVTCKITDGVSTIYEKTIQLKGWHFTSAFEPNLKVREETTLDFYINNNLITSVNVKVNPLKLPDTTKWCWKKLDMPTYSKLCDHSLIACCKQPFIFRWKSPHGLSISEDGIFIQQYKYENGYVDTHTVLGELWFLKYKETDDYIILRVTIPKAPTESLAFIKINLDRLTDWTAVRLFQFLYNNNIVETKDFWKFLLNSLGKSTYLPSGEVELWCPTDPNEYPKDIRNAFERIKSFYLKMKECSEKANEVIHDWLDYACQECKKKKAYSEYDYNLCVKYWQQKLDQIYSDYQYYKAYRDGDIESIEFKAEYKCWLKVFPEYKKYLEDPPIETSLPDCEMPLPQIRNFRITPTEVSFEYYAPTEMRVLVELAEKRDGTYLRIDDYELNFRPTWQTFSKSYNFHGGVYCLRFPKLEEYLSPICRTLRIVNLTIYDTKVYPDNPENPKFAIIEFKAKVDYPCTVDIGLYYENGTLIDKMTVSLSNERTLKFVEDLDKVNHRRVCVAPVGGDIKASSWKLGGG